MLVRVVSLQADRQVNPVYNPLECPLRNRAFGRVVSLHPSLLGNQLDNRAASPVLVRVVSLQCSHRGNLPSFPLDSPLFNLRQILVRSQQVSRQISLQVNQPVILQVNPPGDLPGNLQCSRLVSLQIPQASQQVVQVLNPPFNRRRYLPLTRHYTFRQQ